MSKPILDTRDVTLLLAFRVSADQSGIFAMSMEWLDQSSDIMRESIRSMLETEEVGMKIWVCNNQTLLHAHTEVYHEKKLQLIRNLSGLVLVSIMRSLRKNYLFVICITASRCGNVIDKNKKVLTSMSKRMSRNKWNIWSSHTRSLITILKTYIFIVIVCIYDGVSF